MDSDFALGLLLGAVAGAGAAIALNQVMQQDGNSLTKLRRNSNGEIVEIMEVGM